MGLSMGLTGGGKEKEGRDRSASGSIPPPPPASAPIGSRVAAQIHMMDSAVYHGSDAYHDDAAAHAHYVDTDGYPTQPLPGIKYATTRHAVSRSRSGLSIDTAHSGASSAESWRYGSREELFRQKEASKGEEVRLNKEDMYRVVNR
ncbi:hypothetical protein GGG16DRAFT_54822 [Schizophyllum commune]|nr:hypothetical protein K525DRAFT_217230 [Schizophyllum commune Loenen D]